MNPPTLAATISPAWFRTRWFLAGLALGLVVLSWLGWKDARTDYHPGFLRFYPAISPETNYYPTLNEMTAIVRARCRADQVLVIVGGNSILEGVWQPVAELWSRRLQQLLGDRFCVINFAFRGGSPTDGGAVVAETLRREFPRQVYIADEAPFNGVEAIAHEPYRYIFWQAKFRGWLIDTPARQRDYAEYQWEPAQKSAFMEAAISTRLDRIFHFEEFWNRVCFEQLCTVPAYPGDSIPSLLRPRHLARDEEPDAYDPRSLAAKYAPGSLEAEMRIVRNATSNFYRKTADGGWQLAPAKHREMATNYREAFPEGLIPRTLILVSRSSPYYRRLLSAEERARDEKGEGDAVQLWRDAGYTATDYGRDFTDNDYGDRTHLSKTGGAKLAELTAPLVRSMAERMSYLK